MRECVRRRRTRRWSHQAGAEILEFAFAGPVLLTLLLGIMWLGRAYSVYEAITQAAREGARYAVLPSCATCGNTMVDTYTSKDTCLGTSSNVFSNTSYGVTRWLTAANLKPASVASYCQAAVWLNPNTDASVQQCGVEISFTYPVPVAIPFTTLKATTINIPTRVQMRMENQSPSSISGLPVCP
jgi:Flp pilus assembly protein TadG